jgi:hypothetical protein
VVRQTLLGSPRHNWTYHAAFRPILFQGFEAPFVAGAKQRYRNPVDKLLTNLQWGTRSRKNVPMKWHVQYRTRPQISAYLRQKTAVQISSCSMQLALMSRSLQ